RGRLRVFMRGRDRQAERASAVWSAVSELARAACTSGWGAGDGSDWAGRGLAECREWTRPTQAGGMSATISPEHFRLVASRLLEGGIVPFLGAGANLGGRPVGEAWHLGSTWMPNARELTTHLAGRFAVDDGPLIDVADVISILDGEGVLAD